MNEATEAQEKWERSADAWISGMRQGDPNRTHLLDAVMLEAVGVVCEKRVLDVGCGEGRFSRMLAGLGAKITGIDIAPSMVAEAKRQHPDGIYIEGTAESLPFDSNQFDVTLSYVVLVDVSDFRMGIQEMARVTRPDGLIVVSNVNSFASTSPNGWYRDGNNTKVHFPVDHYFEERAIRLEWGGMSVINWHRPLESYMRCFLESGLILRQFREPKPTPEAVQERPSMIDETRIALFNVMVWQKPGVD